MARSSAAAVRPPWRSLAAATAAILGLSLAGDAHAADAARVPS